MEWRGKKEKRGEGRRRDEWRDNQPGMQAVFSGKPLSFPGS